MGGFSDLLGSLDPSQDNNNVNSVPTGPSGQIPMSLQVPQASPPAWQGALRNFLTASGQYGQMQNNPAMKQGLQQSVGNQQVDWSKISRGLAKIFGLAKGSQQQNPTAGQTSMPNIPFQGTNSGDDSAS